MGDVVFCKGANGPSQHTIIPGWHADVNGVLKSSLLSCKRLGCGANSEQCCNRLTG